MGVWLQVDEAACRHCKAVFDATYRYCPHCGLYVLRRGQRVYQEARLAPAGTRRLRAALLVLLELVWTLLCFLAGLALGAARAGESLAGG